MLIKFLTHGKGQALKAAQYVTKPTDHRGILREEVRVLRGHPSMVGQVADSLTFTRGYTSGVIAWAPSDAPSDLEIEEVLGDFERLSFAGLDPDRVAWTAVLHRETGGGVHIHVLVARVDLATGKCLNVAPPGWQKAFDALRDCHNLSHGWARPEDPSRARAVRQDGFKMLIEASSLRANLLVAPDPKALIGEYLLQRIIAGQIGDRADILAALREAGFEINREGRDYVSVKDPETDTKYRLKGGIYESEFSARRAVEGPNRGREEAPREPDNGNRDTARQKFEDIVRKRAEYNRKRFKERVRPSREVLEEYERRLGESVEDYSETSLGGDPFSAPLHDFPLRVQRLSNLVGDAGMAVGPQDSGDGLPERQDLSDHHVSGMDDLPIHAGIHDSLQTEGVEDDGARNPVDRIVQALYRRLSNTRREVGRALERCQRALGKIGSRLSALDGLAQKLVEERSGDPERLSQEVDLVQYAELCGYWINQNESPIDFLVMEKEEDRILIARDDQGRDLYFSLIHPDDQGSFSEFVRKKKALSVGEVRKRMRERKTIPSSSTPRLPSLSLDWIKKTVNTFRLLRPYSGSVLESRFGLRPETIEKFQDQIREDDQGNVCFLHRNNKGLTGWEVQGESQGGFSEWGTHSFFVGKTGKTITRVVIVQSATEAMSHVQIRGNEGDCYLSLGGGLSRRQLDSLKKVSKNFRTMLIATGDDEKGMNLVEEIEREVHGLFQELPSSGRTWNEKIQNESEHSKSEISYRNVP